MANKQMGSMFDPHKFSIQEIFSNTNGKTSSTKVVGFLASMVCLLLFIILVAYYLINPAECSNILEFIDRTITYFTVSAGLMGIKSVTSAFGKQKVELTTISKDKSSMDVEEDEEPNAEDTENEEENK